MLLRFRCLMIRELFSLKIMEVNTIILLKGCSIIFNGKPCNIFDVEISYLKNEVHRVFKK